MNPKQADGRSQLHSKEVLRPIGLEREAKELSLYDLPTIQLLNIQPFEGIPIKFSEVPGNRPHRYGMLLDAAAWSFIQETM